MDLLRMVRHTAILEISVGDWIANFRSSLSADFQLSDIVRSVPEADVICIVLYLFMGGTSVEMLMAEGFINGGLSILDIKLDMDIKGIKYGQFHQ